MRIEESEKGQGGFRAEELYRPIERELEQVREQLMLELRSDDAQINAMCRHVSRYQGKLLRPAVLLLSGQACGTITPDHIAFGVIIELLHLATLIHDDVLDQASIRRKSVTTNALWGNETSVLLGDYLLSQAFDLCNRTGNLKINRVVSSVARMICQGEMLQCMSRGQWDLAEERYLEIIHMKTGCLYQMCCRVGAELAGGSREAVEALERYGLLIGRGFQVVDDLLDLTGSESTAGKTLGSDLSQAKPTLPTIHFCRRADQNSQAELIKGIAKEKKDKILALLESRGSLKYTQECAEQFIRQAKEELKKLEASQAGQALAAIADFVVRRSC